MKKILIICLAIFLTSGINHVTAAQKPAKLEKARSIPSRILPKVPEKIQSAVELTGNETPEQMLKAYTDAINSLVPQLGTNDLQYLQKLETTVHQACSPGAEKERSSCCQAIACALQQDLPLDSCVCLVKQLNDSGKAEVVPVLTKLLSDKEERIREAARCALQNNPTQEAGAALRDALGKSDDPAWQAAIALALAGRKDEASVPAIANLANGKNEKAAVIALDALAMIGNKESCRAIHKVMTKGTKEIQAAVADAYLKCAGADEVSELFSNKYPPRIKYSALQKMIAAGGDKSIPRMVELIGGQDYRACEIALGQIKNLSKQGRNELIKNLSKLPNTMQAIVLESLANLGEKAVLPIALESAKNSDPAIHSAGIAALGRLGDDSVVVPLCQTLSSAKDVTERLQIEQILVSLAGGKETDSALMETMKQSTGDTQRSLISVLSKRNCHDAFNLLMSETGNQDVVTARTAFQALGNISLPGDATVLIQKVADLKKGDTRGEAENAAARTIARMEKPADQTAVILPILEKTSDPDAKCSVLRLLRIPGDSKALETVKSALQDKEQRVRDSAIRTLGEWPDDSAWTTLEVVYLKPEKDAHRVLALRGLVRLAMGQPDKPNPRLFQRCTQLMKTAEKDDDKKLILGGLGNARTPAALKVITPLLSNPGIKAEATMAIKRIAQAIMKKHPGEAQQALNQLKNAGK